MGIEEMACILQNVTGKPKKECRKRASLYLGATAPQPIALPSSPTPVKSGPRTTTDLRAKK
jgi:hypothetical protein